MLIRWSLKYQGVEGPNLQGVSCRPRFDCRMTFPILCLTPERWMGLRVLSPVGYFPHLCFLVGLRKQFINNFVFPTLECAAGFNTKKL